MCLVVDARDSTRDVDAIAFITDPGAIRAILEHRNKISPNPEFPTRALIDTD